MMLLRMFLILRKPSGLRSPVSVKLKTVSKHVYLPLTNTTQLLKGNK